MNKIVRKFVIEKQEIEKLKEIFNTIKISDEYITNIRDGKCIIQLQNNEVLIDISNIKLFIEELQDKNDGGENEKVDNNNNDELDLDSFDALLSDAELDMTSKYPEIITTNFNSIIDILKSVTPTSDILVLETNSEYIYEFKISSGRRDFVIKYTDFKTSIIDEYRSTIEEFENRIKDLGEKLDTITIDNFSDIQKLIKKSDQGIYLVIDNEEGKIVKLIGNVTVMLSEDEKYNDIDDNNLYPLEIALPKYLNTKVLTIELYTVKNEDNEDVYIIKYIPEDEKLSEYNVDLHIYERPKDLETDKSIF